MGGEQRRRWARRHLPLAHATRIRVEPLCAAWRSGARGVVLQLRDSQFVGVRRGRRGGQANDLAHGADESSYGGDARRPRSSVQRHSGDLTARQPRSSRLPAQALKRPQPLQALKDRQQEDCEYRQANGQLQEPQGVVLASSVISPRGWTRVPKRSGPPRRYREGAGAAACPVGPGLPGRRSSGCRVPWRDRRRAGPRWCRG
jgi:hypothetical protein